jgi:alpha-N-arabinofuranosidase
MFLISIKPKGSNMAKQGSLRTNPITVIAFAVCLFSVNIRAQTSTLVLNVDQAKYKIERAIYGHLFENLGRDIYNGAYVGLKSSIPNTDGWRNDITQAWIEQGQPCLEWPGGAAAAFYHWKDGIGPVANRPGGDMSNGVGTDEYFKYSMKIGAIPYVTCNIRTASAAENAAWLNHIDSVPEWGKALKYWKLGNEEYGGGTVDQFISRYNAQIAGIPSKWNGRLIRIAESGYDMGWIGTIMDNLMGKMEAVSYHGYTVNWGNKGPSINFNETQWYNQLSYAYGVENTLKRGESTMNAKDPSYTVGIMVDEWGNWFDELAGNGGGLYQQNSVRDAVVAMINLNVFNNHCRRVKMALCAQAVNVLQASFLTQLSPGTAMVKTPTYYVLKMLRPHQDATMIPTTLTCGNVNNVPLFSASASIDSTKAIHISISNNHVSAQQTITITLSGTTTTYTSVTGQIVNGPSYSSYNDFNKPEEVNLQPFPPSNFSLQGTKLTATLPAHSSVMLTLTPPVGVIPAVKAKAIDKISIRPEIGGKIVVTGLAAQKMPVSLTMYAADGRVVSKANIKNKATGADRFEWQPSFRAGGIYIMKIQSGLESESRRITTIR